MMKAVMLVLGIGFISLIQLKQLVMKQTWKDAKKEVFVYLGIMLFTAAIGVLMIMGMNPPSPALPLEALYENIGKLLLKQ